jgi:hypothetical protein
MGRNHKGEMMKKGVGKALSRKQSRETDKDMQSMERAQSQDKLLRVRDMRSKFFGGIDPRRKWEVADAGMVQEDQSAMSNLSMDFVHTEYPTFSFYSNPYSDDTVD